MSFSSVDNSVCLSQKKRLQETTATLFEEKGCQIVCKVDQFFSKLNIPGIFFALILLQKSRKMIKLSLNIMFQNF